MNEPDMGRVFDIDTHAGKRQESKRTGEGQGNENALMLAILVTKSRLAVPLADDEC